MIRLSLYTLLFISLFNTASHAQEQIAHDSIPAHKVMLIPYDPRYYLSDADRDIMEQSKMDGNTIRSSFRHNIDRHVQRAIGAGYQCISLLNDTADGLQETLYQITGHMGYRYEKAIPITPKTHVLEKTITKVKESNTKDHEDSKTASRYIPVAADALYMHAIVAKPQALFDALYEQYQTDIFVFLTQFEIKTNYKSCMDIANKIYKREVMVHFTIYNRQGQVIAGSYATSFFPSNSNHANKIIGDNFPELAGYIAGCLP